MLDILVIALLIVFMLFLLACFLGKTKQPLTSNEVDLTFAIHKKQTGYTGKESTIYF